MGDRMTDSDRVALTQAAIGVFERSWRARARVVEEVESAGRDVLTDAEQAEFLRLTSIINNLNSPHWRPPAWPCEVQQATDGR
jgi:hypothetical protein